MADVKEYQRIKERVDQLSREAERAEGALAQVLERIKTEFGCETLEAAEAELERLDAAIKTAEEAYDVELAAFKSKWGHLLGDA